MSVNGREITLYKFGDDKDYGYFDINGKSVEKALMKTPINGARLSSGYGLRKHPILGFTKLHTGTDFAAPMGTPIMASGSGTITRAKWCGGGGNCIKIKHNSTYETIYAHMKNFAAGMKVGKKVRQGQIIGYVGSTGISTGPHLHYVVIVNGKKICGILQELIVSNNRKFLIIGIGVNIVSNPDINNKYQATNIFLETKKKPTIKEIIDLIISSYEKFFIDLNSYNYGHFKKRANLMALN